MARRPIAERLAAERERAAAALERVRKLEAQERKTEAARQKRREGVIGRHVLSELGTGSDMDVRLDRWLRDTLPDALTREGDREVMRDFLEGTEQEANE